jgi:hypothetical protein
MWKISNIYIRPRIDGSYSITFIIVECLSLSLQFMTSVLSICEIVLRNRQIIQQILLEMFQVDVLLGINLKRSVYKKTVSVLFLQVLFLFVAMGILYYFDYELWYKDKHMLSGLYKYETNSIGIVLVVQFVNFVLYVKERFKMINSEIVRLFGFCDEVELDGYLLSMSEWYFTESGHPEVTKAALARRSITNLKFSNYTSDGLNRQTVCSRIHLLRDVHCRLNHIARSINSAYQVAIMFEVLSVMTIIALKLHLGLFTIFFENITNSPLTLFFSLNFWWIVFHLSKLILIVISCQYATRQSVRTALVLQRVVLLKPLHPDTLSEIHLFSQQLLHHKLVFSPCGFFVLNHRFLSACVESLITYVIILLQFTHSERY